MWHESWNEILHCVLQDQGLRDLTPHITSRPYIQKREEMLKRSSLFKKGHQPSIKCFNRVEQQWCFSYVKEFKKVNPEMASKSVSYRPIFVSHPDN